MSQGIPQETVSQLVAAAKAAAENAYCPGSGYPVGAALLAEDGRIFVGCNVENASSGLTICAERNAVCRAVADGARRFVAVAVHTQSDPPASPCGACRQVLAEFGRDMAVLLVGEGDTVHHTSMTELLPRPFTFRDLPTSHPANRP